MIPPLRGAVQLSFHLSYHTRSLNIDTSSPSSSFACQGGESTERTSHVDPSVRSTPEVSTVAVSTGENRRNVGLVITHDGSVFLPTGAT
jgi:hypothetical protein